MNDFLIFFEQIKTYPMRLEINYNKITDWTIYVWEKNCGQNKEDIEILHVQDCDMALCFAKAQVALKEWLSRNKGGY